MRLTGFPALVAILVYLAVTVWSVYFLYRIAVHVQAWPFGSLIG